MTTTTMVLVNEILDGSEVTPRGVWPDLPTAVEGFLAQEQVHYANAEMSSVDFAHAAHGLLNLLEDDEPPRPFDFQFESGFGSWDVQFVTVEVHTA